MPTKPKIITFPITHYNNIENIENIPIFNPFNHINGVYFCETYRYEKNLLLQLNKNKIYITDVYTYSSLVKFSNNIFDLSIFSSNEKDSVEINFLNGMKIVFYQKEDIDKIIKLIKFIIKNICAEFIKYDIQQRNRR